MRVVGGADPYRGIAKVDMKTGERRKRERAKAGGGTNMPSPVGEGGSRRLTDEAFSPAVEVLRKAMCLLLIHRSAVPLSRCGSGTLGLFHSIGVKFSPLVPLRYQQEKARTGGIQICLLRWEKVAAEADG